MSKAKQRPPSEKQLPIKADMFAREQIKKESELLIEHLRRTAKLSENPVFKSMHLGVPAINYMESVQRKDEDLAVTLAARDLSDGANGKHLLSAGIIPSMPPAKYTSFIQGNNWGIVEEKYNKCKEELDALDDEIRRREDNIKTKIMGISGHSTEDDNSKSSGGGPGNSAVFGASGGSGKSTALININNLSAKAGSKVWGSSFQWSTTCNTRSSSQLDFHWPEKTPPRSDGATGTQYGLLTKWCDDPIGNIYVNPNAKKKVKRR